MCIFTLICSMYYTMVPWSTIMLRFLIFLYNVHSSFRIFCLAQIHRLSEPKLFWPMGARITFIIFPPMRWELSKLNKSSYPQSRILSPFWELCWCKRFGKYHVWSRKAVLFHEIGLTSLCPHGQLKIVIQVSVLKKKRTLKLLLCEQWSKNLGGEIFWKNIFIFSSTGKALNGH